MITANVFGIWRIFVNKATSAPDKASVVLMDALALHNLMRLKSRHNYAPKCSADESEIIENSSNSSN